MTRPPDVRVRRAAISDRPALEAMFLEYKRELVQHDAEVDLESPLEEEWWSRPAELTPLVVESGGTLVGFLLVMGRAYARAVGHEADHHAWELYVRPEVRGAGAAETAVRWAFEEFPGTWTLMAMKANPRAVGFWDRVLRGAEDLVREDRPDIARIVYAFRT